jgi:peptidyl-prolyl cis-trans isomerase A (cyclophilin A)
LRINHYAGWYRMSSLTRRDVLGAAAAAALPAGLPRVRLVTPLGAIVLQLRPDVAPLSASDFLKYVDGGAYDGGRFFRVVRPDNDRGHPPIDVVQGGIRPGVGQGPAVAHETTQRSGLHHLDGTISLTRDAPGTGSGAEFFICIGAQPALDFGGARNPDRQGFAAFGRVMSGMDVVRNVWRQDAGGPSADQYTIGQVLTRPVLITKASRIA